MTHNLNYIRKKLTSRAIISLQCLILIPFPILVGCTAASPLPLAATSGTESTLSLKVEAHPSLPIIPDEIAQLNNGNIWIAARKEHTLALIDRQGKVLSQSESPVELQSMAVSADALWASFYPAAQLVDYSSDGSKGTSVDIPGNPDYVAIDASSQVLMSCYDSGDIKRYNPQSGKTESYKLSGSPIWCGDDGDGIWAYSVSPRLLTSLDPSGTVRMQVEGPFANTPVSLLTSNRNSIYAAEYGSSQVQVFDKATSKSSSLDVDVSQIRGISLDNDGRLWIAGGSDDTGFFVKCIDIVSQNEYSYKLSGAPGYVTSGSQGNMLVTLPSAKTYYDVRIE